MMYAGGPSAQGSPIFWPKGESLCEGSNTRFPSEATLPTFGGIASFLTFPVFPRAKRMDWYPTFSPPAGRNGTIERSSYHERTHHDTRHAIQRTGRSGHVVGADASRARNRRAILALDGADRWSPSCHTRRCCLARWNHPLQLCRHFAEGHQPAGEPARDFDDWLQPLGGRARRGGRGRGRPDHRS